MKPFNTVIAFALLLLSMACIAEDRLVLVSASYGKNIVAICDADGKPIWEYKTVGGQGGHAGHHDVHMLPNGNILFHDSWTHTLEITLDKKIVWEYDSAKQNGNGGVDVHAFARLANGNTMIVESGRGRIIHVDPAGTLVKEFPLMDGAKSTRWVRMSEQGTYVVASEGHGITEYDADGKVIWDYKIDGRVFGARRLKNGNMFICAGGGNRILEIDQDKKIIWEVSKSVPDTDIKLAWMTCIQESAAGNYIVGNCHAGDKNPQIFEINKDKKIVWQFDNYELVGNGLACWEVIEGERAVNIRKKIAELK
jgi:outer membrane protein assembly factor BamB